MMDINRESFIGVWNLYAGLSSSELDLQANGEYLHAFLGGAQSHWGVWSIQQDRGFNVLRLDLQGAQPEIYNGPFGPITMQWPPYEAWAIIEVLPNQVAIYGGLLVRRVPIFPSVQAPPVATVMQAPRPVVPQASQPPQAQARSLQPSPLPTQAPHPTSPQTTQSPQARPAPQAAQTTQSPQTSVAGRPAPAPQLHPVSAPPAIQMAPRVLSAPMPSAQFANIMKQWSDLHESMMASAREANLVSMQNSHDFAKRFIAYARS
ncbi:MAG TPA: hypothetical protein VKY85_26195 [Candidatus Angelobacter sp.]|nr:hypothetical protein [Candidatus Angelobacter sp.]